MTRRPRSFGICANTKSIWDLEVHHKGVDSGIAADRLVEKIKVVGYSGVKVTLKSDS